MIKNTLLGGSDFTTPTDRVKPTDLNDTFDALVAYGLLGEVKMFALSVTGALTKSVLQGKGWAICDGTDIVTTQGITGADITGNAPDLQDRFIKMSSDESSGTTGGLKYARWNNDDGNVTKYALATVSQGRDVNTYDSTGAAKDYTATAETGNNYTETNEPQHYEVAFFIKVRAV